jgi:Tfp pilus assembly protein PilO
MTPRRQMLIAAVAAIAVTVLFFSFALRPKLSQIQEVRDEIETSQGQERSLQAELDRLKEASQDRTETIRKLNLLDRYLPDDADLPGFILAINEAADAAGMDLQSIAPSNPSTMEGAEGVQVINVTLATIGGFYRLEDFLIRLENLRRLVEVRSLTITPQTLTASEQVTLSASIALEMYVTQPGASVTGTTTGGTTPVPTPTPETS